MRDRAPSGEARGGGAERARPARLHAGALGRAGRQRGRDEVPGREERAARPVLLGHSGRYMGG